MNVLPNFLARTRTRKRVGTTEVPCLVNSFWSLAGTLTRSSLVVPTPAFTKTALPPSRLKTTEFLLRPRRKFLPRTSSVWPISTFIGRTEVTTGSLAFLLLGRSLGVDGGARSRGGKEGTEGGHEGGAAQ